MKKYLFVLLMLLLPTVALATDTLEVFILRVEFQKEDPKDNSLTTGIGTFDSDTAKSTNYILDPLGKRGNIHYWERHLDFANNYFNKISGGRLAIKTRVFPLPGSSMNAYTVDKQIIDYNRTSKLKGEKTAEFDDARSRDYLSFVYDAILAAAKADTSDKSPFKIPLSKNPNTKRAYMIAHAGASRLVDGGSMGTKGADTPADFMDVYISDDAWEYLMPDSAKDSRVVPSFGLKADSEKDSVVNGLIIPGSVLDTLRSVMVVSETASQDGLNWGINGIIVNQIGRELGMPNTYDVVKGISRLGYYDMMDFAGYNAGNGFMPSMPSAWLRAYMGWGNVKEVRPTVGNPVTVDVVAAGTGKESDVEIVKVPLNGSEYLLIENRQRSWNKEGKVSVVFGKVSEDRLDTTIRTVPVDSISLLFEDSTYKDGKATYNKKKGKGLIVDMDSYDAALPSSGIAVWKVNDWYLRETLPFGIANFWGGDTLRDHQFGISLVEADGVLSIGKTFKNALGEDTYDYGSGTDLLPHVRYGKNTGKKDTIKTIEPDLNKYANTGTTQGGYTGIRISVEIPKKARKEKTANGFMGDSVVNFVAPVMRVTISVDDGRLKNSQFPRNLGMNSAVRGAVFVDYPAGSEAGANKALVIAGEDGTLQMFSALGDTLASVASDTAVVESLVTKKGVEQIVPLYRLDVTDGPFVGMASDGKSVYSLHNRVLAKTDFDKEMFATKNTLKLDSALVGPMYLDGKVWVAVPGKLKSAEVSGSDFKWKDSIDLESGFNAQNMAYCPSGKKSQMVVVDKSGKLALVDLDQMEVVSVSKGEKGGDKYWNILCADIDRNDKMDVALLGSRGTYVVYAADKDWMPLWSARSYKRGETGSKDLSDELSPMAIGDINGDGYPEVVFLGYNLVYALDRFGLPLPGFPVALTRGTPVYGFFSDPILLDVNNDKKPEILVPSSDGLIYAINGDGKRETRGFPLSAGSFEYGLTYAPMSIYAVDGSSSNEGPELYAFHRNQATAFGLSRASKTALESPAAWPLPAGSDYRLSFFDASLLGKVGAADAKDEIKEFFIYPNPVRGGNAKARFEVGNKAKSATLELFDITGLCIFKAKMSDVLAGRNEFGHLDLSKLGSDVYTARLKIQFESGKTKQKLYRLGVIR